MANALGRPRRILHVVNRVSDRGDGIANVCIDVACEQAANGYAVGLACAEGGFVPLAKSNGVEHFPIEFFWRKPQALVRSHRGLRRLYREFAPDAVHAHTLAATVVAKAAAVGMGIPVVATVHNEYQRGVALMGVADRVVAVSQAVADAMARRGISRKRIRTVRNGTVGSARHRAGRKVEAPMPELAPTSILALGAISQRKGVDVLLEAFQKLAHRHPDCHLYFVGNLDWPEIAERAARSGYGDRVHFEGFHPQPQLYLRQATVFALASRHDPFPLVLLEALEAGAAIVASNVDGIPEALDQGRAGVLVAPGSSEELAAAIGEFLNSPELRARYGEAARHRSNDFSVALMTSQYGVIYDELKHRTPVSEPA